MANSKVGQYRLEYNVLGFDAPVREHVVGVWVAPLTTPASGAAPADIDIQLLGGGSKNLQEVADQLCGFLRRLYSASISIEDFTLWRYATEFSRDFVSAGTAVPGVGGTSSVNVAAQQTLTLRHANGGIGKIVLLESNRGGDERLNLVADAAGDDVQRLAAYLLSADSPMIALDNSFPVAALRDSRGQNESVWRKVYRQ